MDRGLRPRQGRAPSRRWGIAGAVGFYQGVPTNALLSKRADPGPEQDLAVTAPEPFDEIDSAPEPGVGTPAMWLRFLILLVLVAVPLVFLFRAGDRRVGATTTVTGVLTWGHEVRSFRPCGGDRDLWIVGELEVIDLLAQDLGRVRASMDAEPYVPVTAVLIGEILPRTTEGFAADYDGRFRIVAIDRVVPTSVEACPGGDGGP
jgi:hypothetical protein